MFHLQVLRAAARARHVQVHHQGVLGRQGVGHGAHDAFRHSEVGQEGGPGDVGHVDRDLRRDGQVGRRPRDHTGNVRGRGMYV